MEKDIAKALRFTLISLLIFSLLYTLPLQIIPWQILESITAHSTAILANLSHHIYTVIEQESMIYIQGGIFTIAIIPLCTGYIEFAVLVAFILASEDRSLTYRIKGVLGAVIFTYIANILRIYGTILATNTLTRTEIDVLHNIGFKVLLFVVVAGYYAVWYVGIPKLLHTHKYWSMR